MTLFRLAPKIIIISGPRATLGREFSMVRNGSIIELIIGNSYSIMAIMKPSKIPRTKAIIISYKVAKI